MADFAAIPLFTDAIMADTQHLDDAEFGRYVRLLMITWRSPECRIPNDPAWISKRLRVDPLQYDKCVKPIISEFYKSDGNWLTQKRLSKEWQYVKGSKGRSVSGSDGRWDKREDRALRSSRLSEARKKGRHTDSEWRELLSLCGNKCVRCGASEKIVRDHIIPIYQGGSDGIENLQPLCKRCNSSKGSENTDHRNPLILNQLKVRKTSAPSPSPSPTKKSKEDVLSDEIDEDDFLRQNFDIGKVLKPEAVEEARRAAPGWDVYALMGQFNEGIRGKSLEIPKNPDKAFPAWCKAVKKGKPPK